MSTYEERSRTFYTSVGTMSCLRHNRAERCCHCDPTACRQCDGAGTTSQFTNNGVFPTVIACPACEGTGSEPREVAA